MNSPDILRPNRTETETDPLVPNCAAHVLILNQLDFLTFHTKNYWRKFKKAFENTVVLFLHFVKFLSSKSSLNFGQSSMFRCCNLSWMSAITRN